MLFLTRARLAGMCVVLPLGLTAPAHADCQGSHAIDRCLVGTWKQTGGGAAEWMRRNIHMAHVSVSASNKTMTIKPDGTFATARSNSQVQVQARDSSMTATGNMTAQGSGQWSAGGGKLNLCMGSTTSNGTIHMQGRNGMHSDTPMAHIPAGQTSVSYTCGGDTLQTVQPMPRNTTMTTTYTRTH